MSTSPRMGSQEHAEALLDKHGIDSLDAFEDPTEEEAPSADTPAPQPSTDQGASSEEDEERTEQGEAKEASSSEEEESEEEKRDDEGVETQEIDGETLASLLGVDPSLVDVTEDGKVQFRTKVNGEEGTSTLESLIKNHQLESHSRATQQKLAERQKALEAEAQQTQAQLHHMIQQAEAAAMAAKKRVAARYQSINWEELRQSDPGEYAAKQQEFALEIDAVDAEVKGILDEANARAQQQQQQAREQYNTWVNAERQKFIEANPELTDAEAAKTMRSGMQEYLRGVGFSDGEISQVGDSRLLTVIRDAVRWQQSQAKVAPAKKRVVTTPRVLKPGSPQSPKAAQDEKRTAALARVKKTGRVEDMVDGLLSTGLIDRL